MSTTTDVERHGDSSTDAIEVLDHDLVATAQDEKDAKELIARTGYKQAMKRRVWNSQTFAHSDTMICCC